MRILPTTRLPEQEESLYLKKTGVLWGKGGSFNFLFVIIPPRCISVFSKESEEQKTETRLRKAGQTRGKFL